MFSVVATGVGRWRVVQESVVVIGLEKRTKHGEEVLEVFEGEEAKGEQSWNTLLLLSPATCCCCCGDAAAVAVTAFVGAEYIAGAALAVTRAYSTLTVSHKHRQR